MNAVFTRPKFPRSGFTDAFLESLALAPRGQKYELWDIGQNKYLSIRVSCFSKKFYMSARWTKEAVSATLRLIGVFTKIDSEGYFTLDQARAKARGWEKMRKVGIDPHLRASTIKIAKGTKDLAAKTGIFSIVAEAFLARSEFRSQRQSERVEREIRRNLLDPTSDPWIGKHISKIDDGDIAKLIAVIRARAPYEALHTLGHIRRIFSWALLPKSHDKYHIKSHPLANLRRKDFEVKTVKRKVTLDDREVMAFWRAAERLGYPYGKLYQILLVTGQRVSDFSKARWWEFNLSEKNFTIPEVRFKSEVDHAVPLSDLALEILKNITYEYHWIERDEVYRSTILTALHADLIVMGTPPPNFISGIWSLKSILSKAELPVIVVPPLWVKKEPPNRILAGWNGSSIPRQLITGLLLLLADSVSIDLIANDRSGKIAGGQPGGDLALYMARHGAKVSVQMPAGYVRSSSLFGMAEHHNFDLVAFAASRLSWIDAFPFGIGQPYLSAAAKVPFLIVP